MDNKARRLNHRGNRIMDDYLFNLIIEIAYKNRTK